MKHKTNRLRRERDSYEAKLVLCVLRKHRWMLEPTAAEYGCPVSTLRYVIKRNPKLAEAYAKHGRGRGRPKKSKSA